MTQTSLRLRVVPRIPSNLVGANGVTVIKENLDFVVKNDYGSIAVVPAISDPDHTFVLLWNSVVDNYQTTSFTDVINNIQSVIVGPNLAGIAALTVGVNQVPYYLDNTGAAATYTVSDYVRSVSNANDEESFLTAINAVQPSSGPYTFPARVTGGDATTDFATLAAEAVSSTNGIEIVIPTGDWTLLADTITLAAASGTSGLVKVRAESPGSIIKAANSGDYLIQVTSGKIVLDGVRLDGNGTVSKCIKNSPSGQVNYDFRMNKVDLRNAVYGFYNDTDGQNWHVADSFIFNNSGAGIYSANDSRNASVTGNTIYNLSTGGDGIVMRKNTQQPEGFRLLNNCTLTPGGKAFDINAGLSLDISHNIFDQAKGCSFLGDASNAISGVELHANWYGGIASGRSTLHALEVFGNTTDVNFLGGQFASFDDNLYIHDAAVQRVTVEKMRFRPVGTLSTNFGLKIDGCQTVNVIDNKWSPTSPNSQDFIEVNSPRTSYSGNRFSKPPIATTNYGTNARPNGGNWGWDLGVASGDNIRYGTNSSISSPAFSFLGDEDTGFGRVGANSAAVVANAVIVAQFDSAGINLPIGTGLRGANQVIADDTAFSFTPPNTTGMVLLSLSEGACEFRYSAIASPVCVFESPAPPSFFAVTTGALTGTTGDPGSDTFITVSAANDGKIYIQNRRGASRTIRVSIRY